jgi:thioredoxin reductase (NADPH)
MEMTMAEERIYDCIIIGAGPGGLQAAIYLGRYNRKVLLIDRGGGRTMHARHIENFLSQTAVSGKELIEIGKEQARHFGTEIVRSTVVKVTKRDSFEVSTRDGTFLSRFVIVSAGASDNIPPVEHAHRFLGSGFYTCIDCDGYRTTGKKLVVLGNSLKTVHLALAMKEMYTDDITLVLYFLQVPEGYGEELNDEGIALVNGRPLRVLGADAVEGLEMEDGRVIDCEAIMSNFGYKLNDGFLADLHLNRDREGFKFVTDRTGESSLPGLYIVGPLTGNDQAIIAAGQGAAAAIDLKGKLLGG